MKKRKVLLAVTIASLAISLFSLVCISTTTSATQVTLSDGEVIEFNDGENILRKWTFMDFYHCAQNGVFKSPIDLNSHRGDVTDDLLNGGGGTYDLPTGLSSDANDKWSCKKAFNGEGLNWRGTSGVLDYLGGKNVNWNNSSENVAPLLEKLGYEPAATNNDKDVIEISAHFSCINGDADGNGTDLTALCQSFYGDGNSYLGKIKLNGESVFGNLKYKTVDFQSWDSTSTPVFISGNSSKVTIGYNGNFNDSVYQQCLVYQKTVKYDKQSFAKTANDISAALSELSCTIYVPISALTGTEDVSGSSVDTVSVGVSFSNTNPGEVSIAYDWTNADNMLVKMGFGGGASDLLLTDNEKYGLYEFYVEQALKIKGTSDLKEKLKCAAQTNDGSYADYQEIYLKSGGKWSIRYYDPADLKKTSGFNVQNDDLTTSSIGFDEIKARLKAMAEAQGGVSSTDEDDECAEIDSNVDKVDDKVVDDGSSTQYASSNSGDPSDKCYDGAGVLGHTLCPILSAVSQFTDQIYYFIENNFLMINANEMLGDPVRDAWGTVRDIANVGFVIVLLIVIFSQVTGFGIDNYGIKRILPRLIVTAVLVNISFLICQVMVDVSNIVGVSLKDFLSTAIPLQASTIGSSGGAAGILGTIAGGGILIGITILNPGILLSLVTAIIGVVISLLFLFVILIARQIGVVLLIILAPVAFICYMLPNTEKIFTSWRKIFTALLLAYPICALAMGGGTLVGNLLANIGKGYGGVEANPVLLIGAMIVNVIPFFLIPTILKRSMAGLGNLGATLSGLGQRLGRGATGAMRGSAGYKALQNSSMERRNRIKAGLNAEGNLTKIGQLKSRVADSRFGKAVGYGKLQKARIASAEKAITDQALGTGQLVQNASAERFQNSINAIKTQATNDGTINNLAGNTNYDGIGDDFNFDDPSSLEAHAYQAALNGDKEGMYAYMELLSNKGHAGQEGATQVISKLQANGKHAEAQMMAQAIMNNSNLSGQYKSGARSQYNGLKNLASAKDPTQVANVRSLSNIKAGDYSKQSLASADKEELVRLEAAMKDPNFKDAAKLKEMAMGALNDSMIEGGTKLKNEEIMRRIAGVPAGEGSVSIDHKTPPAPMGEEGDTVGQFNQASGSSSSAADSTDSTGESYEDMFNQQRE